MLFRSVAVIMDGNIFHNSFDATPYEGQEWQLQGLVPIDSAETVSQVYDPFRTGVFASSTTSTLNTVANLGVDFISPQTDVPVADPTVTEL